MKTLLDKVWADLRANSVFDFDPLIKSYGQDKYMAKSFSIFAYLVARGYQCSPDLAERYAEVMEAFFLATSIHDDIVDSLDEGEEALGQHALNARIVLGDYFFVEMAVQLARIVPEMDPACREGFLDYFRKEMMVVAESQLTDQRMAGKPYSVESSLQQADERGGSWGRLVMGSISRACGASEADCQLLTRAANQFFLALTLLDDLQDLSDDIANGIYSLAPSHYLNQTGNLHLLQEAKGNIKQIRAELEKTASLKYAINTAIEYTEAANKALDDFLQDKEGMYWFQLKAFFNNLAMQLKGIGGTYFERM